MKKDDFLYNKRRHKSILFFSASAVSDANSLIDFDITEVLVSYHYIRKNKKYFEREMRAMVEERNGIFMTDSGAFSFMGTASGDEMYEEKYWLPYLEEYVAWLRENKDYIFVAANLDLDTVVGRDVVRKWNRMYFEPLEKEGLQIVYVAHEDDDDPNAIQHFTEYCGRYQYVGINQKHKAHASKFFTIAKQYRRRVHGFAWTEFALCKQYPFFSIDSTTWLGGARYGTTYDYDGKNFRTLDYKKKFRRKARKLKYDGIGVNLPDVTTFENRKAVNRMNIYGWVGFRKEYLKMADLKLWNNTVATYEKKC